MNDEGWICECSYWNRPTHPSSESPSNCQICGRPRPRRQNERVHTGTKQMIHSPPAINQQWMFTHCKSASTLPSQLTQNDWSETLLTVTFNQRILVTNKHSVDCYQELNSKSGKCNEHQYRDQYKRS
eukprot:922758_1